MRIKYRYNKIWLMFLVSKLAYMFFALFIYSNFTSLGDTARYISGRTYGASNWWYSSTQMMDFLAHSFSLLLGPILANVPFMLLSTYGVYYSVCRLKLSKKRLSLVLLILSTPSFGVWTSIASKEAMSVFFLGIILGFMIDKLKKEPQKQYLIFFIALYLCAVFKPQYLIAITVALLFIYTTQLLSLSAIGKLVLFMIAIGASLLTLYVFRDIINELSFIMPTHFRLEAGSTRINTVWINDFDVFWNAPYGMFISFIGPTLSEATSKVTHLFAFLESSLIISIFFYFIFKLSYKTLSSGRLNILYFSIFAIIILWILFVHYPFGVLNPGSAIRYREISMVFSSCSLYSVTKMLLMEKNPLLCVKFLSMKTVMHIISGLSDGGAEGVLYRICLHDKANKHVVVSMTDDGKYGALLRKSGVQVYCLEMSPRKLTLSALYKFYRLIKNVEPSVVQTWMYHADLIGGLVARIAGVKEIYWNLRHTDFSPQKSKKTIFIIVWICSYLSFVLPKKVICCAQSAFDVHAKLGYKESILKVVNNGFNVLSFMPTKETQLSFRRENNIKIEVPVVGMVARFNQQKDHRNLLKAFSIALERYPTTQLVLVGHGMDKNNDTLQSEIASNGLGTNVILLGQRADIDVVMNGIDLHVLSSSFGEGFPNVLAEAMLCGTPCIATNVGDARLIVSDTGWIVPPSEPVLLAQAILAALDERSSEGDHWLIRQQLCRRHIIENFSIEKMLSEYLDLWFGKFDE